MQSQKWQNDLCSFLRHTIQYNSNPSLCPDQYCWKSWSWTVLWRTTNLLELTPQKDVLFIIGDWNAKIGSPEIPGGNGQIWPWSTEWSRAKTNRVLSWEHTGHSKHPLPTAEEKTLHMDITRWPTLKSDWLYLQPKMEKLYTVSTNKTRSWLAQIMKSLLTSSDLNWRK